EHTGLTDRVMGWFGLARSGGSAQAATGPPDAQPEQTETSPEDTYQFQLALALLKANVTVEQIKDTDAMRVSFTHTDPKTASDVAKLPKANTDPKTTELQKQLYELEKDAAQLETKYGADNPHVVENQKQIAAVERQLDASRKALAVNVEGSYERAVQDEAALNA